MHPQSPHRSRSHTHNPKTTKPKLSPEEKEARIARKKFLKRFPNIRIHNAHLSAGLH